MQNYTVPPAADVLRPARRERLSTTDELRRIKGEGYAEADNAVEMCRKQIKDCETELSDASITASRKKTVESKVIRLKARMAALLRELEKAQKALEGGRRL